MSEYFERKGMHLVMYKLGEYLTSIIMISVVTAILAYMNDYDTIKVALPLIFVAVMMFEFGRIIEYKKLTDLNKPSKEDKQ